jgi:hypothetical protein
VTDLVLGEIAMQVIDAGDGWPSKAMMRSRSRKPAAEAGLEDSTDITRTAAAIASP